MDPGSNDTDGDTERASNATAGGRPVKYAVEFDWNDGPRISTLVVEVVAEMADLDPIEMDEPLYEIIDPDSLDELFRARIDGVRRTGGRIEFEVQDLAVTVYGDGVLEVAHPERAAVATGGRAE